MTRARKEVPANNSRVQRRVKSGHDAGAPRSVERSAASAARRPTRQATTREPTDAARTAADCQATLEALVAQANRGDKAALADLRGYLTQHPEVWQTCGDLGKCAERAWLLLFSQEALGTESIKRHIEQLRADLAGPSPTPVERLLVNRVVVCYLALHQAELVSARPDPSSPAQVAIRLKRCESTQRRYLGALRMLALLRATLPQGLIPVNSLRLHGGEQQERKRA
ncbi:MAG TPA: hypothetical protein VKD72_23655 [Gemmataceae bacterium]|nr:hypothetical protein [Gemmataceae bacterium]